MCDNEEYEEEEWVCPACNNAGYFFVDGHYYVCECFDINYRGSWKVK